MDQTTVQEKISPEMKQAASRNARDKAMNARWDLNIAIFLFAVLIVVIILLFQNIGLEVVGPVAAFGLMMVWLVGWRRGKQLYARFYDEELARLQQQQQAIKDSAQDTVDQTIEERVQKALRERWH